jgi:cytochrome c553
MKRILLAAWLLASGTALAAENPLVEGDAEAGQQKSATCAACHGPDGNSSNPEWPVLAGQHPRYIVEQLKAYKSGARRNAVMQGQVAKLSEQDMKDLAAFYAEQAPKQRTASEEAVEIAQPLWRGGDAERDLPACTGCHGPAGIGNAGAAYPRISAQHPKYTAAQLRAYRAGERGQGTRGQMMQHVAAELTDEEIEALASYVAGLQPRR